MTAACAVVLSLLVLCFFIALYGKKMYDVISGVPVALPIRQAKLREVLVNILNDSFLYFWIARVELLHFSPNELSISVMHSTKL